MPNQDYYVVYKVTNLTNNKIYIGYQKNGKADDNYRGSGPLVKKAVDKYGIENFSKEILYVFYTEQEAYDKEKEIVNEQFVAREDTYNLTLGGRGGWNYVNSLKLSLDPKIREKQSIAQNNSETRQRKIESLKETNKDPKVVKRRKEAAKKVQNQPEVREKQKQKRN